MKHVTTTLALLGLSLALGTAAPASAGDHGSDAYEVTITNLTRGQSFTPILVVTHEAGVRLFDGGQAASDELAALAEGGDIGPLTQALLATGKVGDFADSGGLLDPGQSVTVTVAAPDGARHVSLAGMLIPTNDAFVAVTDVALPKGSATRVLRAAAYDAGSEPNDELCANIPGPVCGGAGGSPDAGGEGFVHIHAGIHGIGDLVAAERDWRNPVAEVTIRRASR